MVEIVGVGLYEVLIHDQRFTHIKCRLNYAEIPKSTTQMLMRAAPCNPI